MWVGGEIGGGGGCVLVCVGGGEIGGGGSYVPVCGWGGR